jgi:hypothetical protein
VAKGFIEEVPQLAFPQPRSRMKLLQLKTGSNEGSPKKAQKWDEWAIKNTGSRAGEELRKSMRACPRAADRIQ